MLRDLFSLFPAYAGVIRLNSDPAEKSTTFPRIRGGDPLFLVCRNDLQTFSPHTRG